MKNNAIFSFIRGPLLVCCFVSLFLGSESGRAEEGATTSEPVAISQTENSATETSPKALLRVVDEDRLKSVEVFQDGEDLLIQKTINGEVQKVVIEADSIAGSIALSVLDELAAEGIIHDGEAILDLAELSGEGVTIQLESEHEDSTSFGETVIGILAVTLIFGTPIFIVGLVLYSRYRRRQLLHESMNKLIDNGREIPDNLFNEIEGSNDHDATLRKGMTSTGLGIAIAISLSLIADPTVGSLGLIPLMIGLAHLLIWKINSKQKDAQA